MPAPALRPGRVDAGTRAQARSGGCRAPAAHGAVGAPEVAHGGGADGAELMRHPWAAAQKNAARSNRGTTPPPWYEKYLSRPGNTKGYSSTYLAMGFANVRAGTWYPPEH